MCSKCLVQREVAVQQVLSMGDDGEYVLDGDNWTVVEREYGNHWWDGTGEWYGSMHEAVHAASCMALEVGVSYYGVLDQTVEGDDESEYEAYLIEVEEEAYYAEQGDE